MDTGIRVEIGNRERFGDDVTFGDVGAYERLSGRVRFGLDPDDPANEAVVDLEYAPRNDEGIVEYAADLEILKPVELRRGNRRLLYGVNNRGRERALQTMNDPVGGDDPSTPEGAGNGFLMRQGYSVVWSGWQGNLLSADDRLTMDVPVARDGDREITGVTRTEFVADEPGIACIPLSGNDYTRSYETVSSETEEATFTKREYEDDPRRPIPPDEWEFAKLDDGEPVPSRTHCYYPAGFDPGWIYELVYTARDPPVMGLGFTGVRDLVSFLRHADADDEGATNPLVEDDTDIEKAYAWGRSQSGRFLREFVYQGFNADARGRAVFDAIMPDVAGGGRVALNQRFAQPGRYPRQHRDHLYPSDQFPFAYDVIDDPLTGETDGIRKRPDTDPLVMHTQTSTEYWSRRGSLVHTDPEGNDLGGQEETRVYLFASAPHSGRSLEDAEDYRYRPNPLDTSPILRALLSALDEWATDGTPPPESQIPTRGEGTAVLAEEVAAEFPAVPGVGPPGEPNRVYVQDFGPEFEDGVISKEPPEEDEKREYAVLVPGTDDDGNEVPGIRPPPVEAPLGTYTGWNFRPEGSTEEALAGITGSYFPFADTEAERNETGDPRPSVEERYETGSGYVRAVAVAAQDLVDRGLLLPEDADRYVERAMAEDRLTLDGSP